MEPPSVAVVCKFDDFICCFFVFTCAQRLCALPASQSPGLLVLYIVHWHFF